MNVNKKAKIVHNRIINQVSKTLEEPTLYFDCIIKDSDLTKDYNNKYINCLIYCCKIDMYANSRSFFNCYYEACKYYIEETKTNWITEEVKL